MKTFSSCIWGRKPSLRAWLRRRNFFDTLLAYAAGGLRAVRLALGTLSVTRPRQAQRAYYHPQAEALEVRQMLSAFQFGDVFVSSTNGQVSEYAPSGTLRQTISDGISGFENTGMAFDSFARLYMTNFDASNISRIKPDGTVDTPNPFVSGDAGSHNESITFDQSGDFYVGQADGTANILKFSEDGTLLARYAPTTEKRGTDWIDLAPDQRTIYYTSEGTAIHRFDVSLNAQLPDFAPVLPGPRAYAVKALPDGDVLVADYDRVLRLNAAGVVVATYLQSANTIWFTLALDPDGQSFWAGDANSSQVDRVDIGTGATLTTLANGSQVQGLAVLGSGLPSYVRAKSPQSFSVPIGEADVLPNDGDLRIEQPLNFRQSTTPASQDASADLGTAPALVYNADSVNIQPIIETVFPTSASQGGSCQFCAQGKAA